ncbi:hypothetical protein KFL_001160010 [Klebsormidium nitens]|uniref:Uncharacterized protein n=1 Tax=Klebsormidium nitens TaxID=105231 RepID=A0A1Y1I1C2_KLENI|nr:hypothetical protein KFL_001160010 [Klebsormidium nitens]|eukprot:GAQ82567.1 hypothetical protein KFL_001160010 [Klebsormidium nitens]
MATWAPISLSGPEELKDIFPGVRGLQKIQQTPQEQRNTGVLPVIGADPVVLQKAINFLFSINSRIKSSVSRSNGREAPKVLALSGLLIGIVEIAKRLPTAAKASATADLGLDQPFASAFANVADPSATTAACTTVYKEGSMDHNELLDDQARLAAVEGEEHAYGPGPAAPAPKKQKLEVSKVTGKASTQESSPSKVKPGSRRMETPPEAGPQVSPPPMEGTAGGSGSRISRLSKGVSYRVLNFEQQYEHLRDVWLLNQSSYQPNLYFTAVFSELQLELVVNLETGEVTVRRAVWEAKASLRQGYRKKIDQAAKTAVCVYINNLAHGVVIKNVYVLFTPENTGWELGYHPHELRGDIFVSEFLELSKRDPKNPMEFKAGDQLLKGGTYILKAFLGDALSKLSVKEMDDILVDIEVSQVLSSIHLMQDAFREEAPWFEEPLHRLERKGDDQDVPPEEQLGRVTRGKVKRQREVAAYEKIPVPVPPRPPPMDPKKFEWRRLLEEGDRYEAVGKEVRRRGQDLQRQSYELGPNQTEERKLGGSLGSTFESSGFLVWICLRKCPTQAGGDCENKEDAGGRAGRDQQVLIR